jgi:hypothetical protein
MLEAWQLDARFKRELRNQKQIASEHKYCYLGAKAIHYSQLVVVRYFQSRHVCYQGMQNE